MKKLLALLLASVVVAGTLAGCGKDKKTESSSSGNATSSGDAAETDTMKDGTYTATYSAAALDRTIDTLTVTVAGGKMTIDSYTAKESAEAAGSAPAEASSSSTASSSAASSDATSSASDSEGTNTDVSVREHLLEILDQYEDVAQDLSQMLPIAGAEEHTYRFIRMVRELEAAAKKGDTSPLLLGKYADGTYKATMPAANGAGWTDYIEATVSGSVLTSITFDATKDGKKITEDTEANAADPKPSAYYPAIVEAFTAAAEDLTKTFPPTGGALALNSFNKLMTPVLANMASGGETAVVVPKYIDGTYTAEFTDFDENGWKDQVTLEIKRDVVTLASFDSIHKDDPKKKRSADTELSDKMKAATGAYSFKEMENELFKALEKSNGDVLKIENVVGATVSTNSFKQLVGEILATTASEGDNSETLQVERMDPTKE